MSPNDTAKRKKNASALIIKCMISPPSSQANNVAVDLGFFSGDGKQQCRNFAPRSRANSERIFEAELQRLKARALLVCGAPGSKTQAQSLLDQALATARSQHARSLELRAAKDLAALWIGQGRSDDALAFLAPIHAWFTEGFDTHDLKEAKVLLDQLQS